MGPKQSNLSETNIYNDIKTSIETTVNNNISNNTSCEGGADQDNEVVIGNCAVIDCPGGVNISQTSQIAMKCISTNTTAISTDIADDIATSIESNNLLTVLPKSHLERPLLFF